MNPATLVPPPEGVLYLQASNTEMIIVFKGHCNYRLHIGNIGSNTGHLLLNIRYPFVFFFLFVDDPFKDDPFGKADVLGERYTHAQLHRDPGPWLPHHNPLSTG